MNQEKYLNIQKGFLREFRIFKPLKELVRGFVFLFEEEDDADDEDERLAF